MNQPSFDIRMQRKTGEDLEQARSLSVHRKKREIFVRLENTDTIEGGQPLSDRWIFKGARQAQDLGFAGQSRQLIERADGEHLAVIDDDDAATELLDVAEVVGGEDHRDAQIVAGLAQEGGGP